MAESRAQGKAVGRPSRGRPRSHVGDRVLGATLALLAEEGYRGMSIDRVAARARVSKPTIYRRWPSKAELAIAALMHRIEREPALPSGRAAPDVLTAILDTLRDRLLTRNNMALVGTLLAEEHHEPDLVRLFRERVWRHRRGGLRQVLDAASARGELRPGADLEAAVAMMIGSLYAAYLAEGTIPAGWPRRIVRTTWRGIGAVTPPPRP